MKKTILVAVAALMLAVSTGSADCFRTDPSRVQYFDECGCYACAYTGGGCTACTNGTDTCYTSGVSCEVFNRQ
jgi:hypothetical protein